MPTKNHKDKVKEIRSLYESKGWRCKEQMPLFNPEKNSFDLIDVTCWKGNEARAFEVEVSGKQVIYNAEALKRFKYIFKNSKVCQLTADMDIKNCDNFKPKTIGRIK